MNQLPRIPTTLAVFVVAACLAALAVLVPGAPGARAAASEPRDCRLPGWAYVLTGHWGGAECR